MSSWESMVDQNVPTNPELVTYKSKIYPFHSLHRSMLSTMTPEIKAKRVLKLDSAMIFLLT